MEKQEQSGSARAGTELSPQGLCSGLLLVVSQEALLVSPKASVASGPVYCQEESNGKLSIGHVLSFQSTVTRGDFGCSGIPICLGFVLTVFFFFFLKTGCCSVLVCNLLYRPGLS